MKFMIEGQNYQPKGSFIMTDYDFMLLMAAKEGELDRLSLSPKMREIFDIWTDKSGEHDPSPKFVDQLHHDTSKLFNDTKVE